MPACLICGQPANGSSLDDDGVSLLWYCRAHHPLMPGGVAARGRWVIGSGSAYRWVATLSELPDLGKRE